ncbi:MAG: type II toxin-antitoxin system VapC family toxin [Proteobacteria bacterium]|nr:type II toxin-antitoxin system VapC family toxin [Pseudomonadota bacterium]
MDTDVLIDISRGIQEAIDCLATIEEKHTPMVSVVTQMELFVGCRNKLELQKAEEFLKRFHVIKLNEDISEIALNLLIKYRLSHGLLIPDALIAATALHVEQSFISKNQRDYCFISDLLLLPYPYYTT